MSERDGDVHGEMQKKEKKEKKEEGGRKQKKSSRFGVCLCFKE